MSICWSASVLFRLHMIGEEQIRKIFPKIYVTTVLVAIILFVTFDTLRMHFNDVFFHICTIIGCYINNLRSSLNCHCLY